MIADLRTRIRPLLPIRLVNVVRRIRAGSSTPPVGTVRFGDLRRTTPIGHYFGYDRGGPIDRYYIEVFLGHHRADIRGRVLEVGDDAYTRAYGGGRVRRADVLHVDPAAGTTFVGDLSDGSFLPDDTFDCVILTQTLHLIYDFSAALRTVRRILRSGGVLLMTVPGITSVDVGEWGGSWHYSFTSQSMRAMCAEAFGGDDVMFEDFGNVLAAIAFLHGLGVGEVDIAELEQFDPAYGMIHAVRVVKRI